MSEVEKLPVQVYTEMTPNPETMKFVSNQTFLAGTSVDYPTAADVVETPVADELFKFPFVNGVFIANNFITVTKKAEHEWEDIIFSLRDWFKEYLEAEKPIFSDKFDIAAITPKEVVKNYSEDEQKIVDILEKYVRPAVEMDGGNITFRKYEEGIVTVGLQGSCSGCPSSTVTLKAGIEGLLKRMMPDVKEVVAEML